MPTPEPATQDLTLAEIPRLDELFNRETLDEICSSLYSLSGIPIQVFSAGGRLLAAVPKEELQRRSEGSETRQIPLEYDGRHIGHMVVGPFQLARTDDKAPAGPLARLSIAELDRLLRHVRSVFDLILFSGHRAHLASQMHLAAIQESYRELEQKNEQLQQAYDRLKELDRLKSNFLATVSHELRTPLTSIIGYSEMMASGMAGSLTEEQQGFAETIRDRGEHLLALISNMLDASKLEQGRIQLAMQSVDPSELIHDVVSTVALVAHSKGIEFATSVAKHCPEFEADPLYVRQILTNLVDNAIKFTPKGGSVRLEARPVRLSTDNGHDDDAGLSILGSQYNAVELSVTDTGIGIPEAELSRIFDAFYQVDGSSTREHGGAGLGLSIVRQLVEAHGGSIRVTSQPNRGSKFVVTLPQKH